VRRYAQAAAKTIGAEPTVRRLHARAWRVALDGQHVMAEAIFEGRPGGPLKWARGTLTIDGRPQSTQQWAELRVTWNRYERPARPPQLGPEDDDGLAFIPATPRGRQVPAEVRQVRGLLASRVGEQAVRIGYMSGRWIAGFDYPGGDGMRIFFVRSAGRGWHMDPDRPMQLVVGGQDVTAAAAENIDQAMARLARAHPPASGPTQAPASKTGRGARDHGVEVRGMVVIRELLSSLWRVSPPHLRTAQTTRLAHGSPSLSSRGVPRRSTVSRTGPG
jgi:hypothetical protein